MTKKEMTQIISEEFRSLGYDALSLSHISKATGLGKASLYHHFPGGKEEMAIEVIRTANLWIENEIMLLLDNIQKPEENLQSALDKLSNFYCGGENYCLLDAMSSGARSENIKKEIKVVSQSWISVFKKIALKFGFSIKEAEKKAQQVICLIQGGLILSRTLQDSSVFKEQIKFIQMNFLKTPS